MSLHKNIIKLWSFLEKKRRIQFFLLIILICLCAFIEMVSIGLVVPFIAILADPKILYSFDIYNLLVKFLHLNNLDNIRIVLFTFFSAGIVLSGFLRFFQVFKEPDIKISKRNNVNSVDETDVEHEQPIKYRQINSF